MSENLFNLEQEILQCWSVTTDIDVLYKAVMDKEMSKDDISNVLLGLSALYELKFQTLFETYEKLFKENINLRKRNE